MKYPIVVKMDGKPRYRAVTRVTARRLAFQWWNLHSESKDYELVDFDLSLEGTTVEKVRRSPTPRRRFHPFKRRGQIIEPVMLGTS